jgi:hypothetical protein
MLNHNYDYRTTLAASQRINWDLEEVVQGRNLDFGKRFMPEALAGVEGITCLSPAEKLKLNQIRGFSYLYLFGLIEEYIVPAVIEHAGTRAHGDDHELRALLHFAEEEAKHIQLFKWFVAEFQRGFHTPCAGIGPAREIAAGILKHSRLGVFLTTLHIEWLTQKHYVESVKDNAGEGLDPLFVSLLRHHWLEESQHAKLDTLIVDQLAGALDPQKVESGIDDYMDIGRMLDGGFVAQVDLDLESLQKAVGRIFSSEDRAEIRRVQLEAYRRGFLIAGMTHPSFDKSLRELSPAGHARVAEMARAMMA